MDTNLNVNLNSNFNSFSDSNSNSSLNSSSGSSSSSSSDSDSNSNSNSSFHSEWNAQKAKSENVPRKRELNLVEDSYLNILNKKKVLYKYVFRYNNRKFKFQLLSTYYEYLMLCKNLINDVTTCNLFFHEKIFSEVLQKPLYYPYILYIYEENDSQENGTKVVEKDNAETQKHENCLNLDFIKMSILDIDEIIEKGKKKEKTYFDGKNNVHTSKIMKCMSEINTELQMYNLKPQKNIVGYVELYLLFHMGRFFDSRIERLVIHKLFRNQKLGLLVMNISIFLLKHLYSSNRCDLTAENEIAINLYKKLHFRHVDTNTFRLYLHSSYNYNYSKKKKKKSSEIKSDNIQTFLHSTFACALQKDKQK